jgi:hypothetical protein
MKAYLQQAIDIIDFISCGNLLFPSLHSIPWAFNDPDHSYNLITNLG